jgi:hypothetical protein
MNQKIKESKNLIKKLNKEKKVFENIKDYI